MNNNRGLAEQLPMEPQADPTTQSARPKVMRRPAQFSDPRRPLPTPVTISPAAAPVENENPVLFLGRPHAAHTALTQKSWQDDLRFGVAMLTIVVLVNLALIAWLPYMRPAPPLPAITTPAAAGMVITPPNPDITFYSKPGTEPVTGWNQEMPAPSPAMPSGADSGPDQ